MIETFRETLFTLLTTSDTAALTLVTILILFGILTGLVASLLIYWMDRRATAHGAIPVGTCQAASVRNMQGSSDDERLNDELLAHSGNSSAEQLHQRTRSRSKAIFMRRPGPESLKEER